MYTTKPSLSSLTLAITLFLQATVADTTMPVVSEYPDGQPQAPTATASSPSDFSSSSLTASTTAISWPISSSSYDNPFTIYTTMTNSLGVITGMPSVWTSQPSQPAVVTSQPSSATLPTYSGYYYNTTSSGSAATTMATSAVVASASNNNGVFTTTSSSRTSAPTIATVTGAASSNKIAGAGVGFIIAAFGFCML